MGEIKTADIRWQNIGARSAQINASVYYFLSHPGRKYHIRDFELGEKVANFRPGYGEKTILIICRMRPVALYAHWIHNAIFIIVGVKRDFMPARRKVKNVIQI